MTTLQETLPCPFCGSTHVGHTKLDYREFVICNGCGAGADSADTAPEKTALEVWNKRTALTQQELPQKERPDFMAGYDAGMADAKRMAQQGEPVCHGCGIPAGDVHMSTCKSGKWPSRVSNGDTAAPAPQAQEPCPDGSKCKHGAWCTEVYCQELCEFRNQPAPQPAQGETK